VKLQELDAAAQGGQAARDRAALAHLAAGNFELSRNENDEAIEQFQSALDLGSKNPQIAFASLLNLSYVHLARSEYSASLEYLDRARTLAPNSAIVAQFSGWAYYGLNRLDDAVAQWQNAQRLQPNPQVAALLAKAERDRTTESSFHQGETHHFVLRYEGGAAPELAEEILQVLEADFRDIAAQLQFTPSEPIGVVLYTGQSFRDITRAPSWAGAINDGRIRVPVQGLTSVSDDLARVLKHELTHSFVRQMTEGRCPTWLNEGLAQWIEGRRSAEDAQALVAAYEQGKYIPLSRLEGPWTGFPTNAARFAYAWALAAVEAIIANSGMWGIQRLLAGLSEERSVAEALGPALQTNYADLELETVQYLRQTYPHQ
jgi:tetratricopeptide (TPR) repeat protein